MRVIVPKAVQLDPLLFDERVSAATPRQKEDLFLDRGCEPDQLHHLTQPFGRYPGPLAHRKNRVRSDQAAFRYQLFLRNEIETC